MPEESRTLGTRRNLSVRWGVDLRPQNVTVQLRTGVMVDDDQGDAIGHLFAGEADVDPIPEIEWDITRLDRSAAGEPRFRFALSRDKVSKLARADGGRRSISKTSRVVYYTWAYRDPQGVVYPMRFGSLTIVMGAANG